ncbi:MAG: hypothetical protein LBN92_01760, partial [Treponema sp.]|nr:hypothetical protein [Treponema sp.]
MGSGLLKKHKSILSAVAGFQVKAAYLIGNRARDNPGTRKINALDGAVAGPCLEREDRLAVIRKQSADFGADIAAGEFGFGRFG